MFRLRVGWFSKFLTKFLHSLIEINIEINLLMLFIQNMLIEH